jgi:hypothetical protein
LILKKLEEFINTQKFYITYYNFSGTIKNFSAEQILAENIVLVGVDGKERLNTLAVQLNSKFSELFPGFKTDIFSAKRCNFGNDDVECFNLECNISKDIILSDIYQKKCKEIWKELKSSFETLAPEQANIKNTIQKLFGKNLGAFKFTYDESDTPSFSLTSLVNYNDFKTAINFLRALSTNIKNSGSDTLKEMLPYFAVDDVTLNKNVEFRMLLGFVSDNFKESLEKEIDKINSKAPKGAIDIIDLGKYKKMFIPGVRNFTQVDQLEFIFNEKFSDLLMKNIENPLFIKAIKSAKNIAAFTSKNKTWNLE